MSTGKGILDKLFSGYIIIVLQDYSEDSRIVQDSHSDYSADPRVVQYILQTQWSCNFNMMSTGKRYIGKLL